MSTPRHTPRRTSSRWPEIRPARCRSWETPALPGAPPRAGSRRCARAAAAVTVAHGGTPLGELRWLVGPDGTAWRVRDEAAAASRGSGWEDEEPRRRSVLTPVPGDTLRAALAELFTDHEVRVP